MREVPNAAELAKSAGDQESVDVGCSKVLPNPRPYERYAGLDTMELAAKVAERISVWSPDAVFVDDGGVGGGVIDRLHQLGFGR